MKFFLLITANPIHDSKAARKVFMSIRGLDILSSKEVDICLPGFHAVAPAENEDCISRWNELLKLEGDSDYHGTLPFVRLNCESSGELLFNDVDFAGFMMDLMNKCPSYTYVGNCDMIVIPSVKGELDFEHMAIYNLEPLVKNDFAGNTLENFLLSVINVLRRDPDRHSITALNKISGIYDSLFPNERNDEKYVSTTIHLDKTLLEYMKWSEEATVFFISYSTKDAFNAFALKSLLEKNGYPVWIAPDGIPSGFDYAQVIPAAIRISSRFIVLLSENSANSKWVRRELEKGISSDRRVDAVMVDGFTIDDVKRFDHLDFLLSANQIRFSINELFNNKHSLAAFLL